MSVSNKTNYNKRKEYWKINNNENREFSMRYCSKSLRKNSSKLGFVTMFLQVYKYFFCSKTNRRSLRFPSFYFVTHFFYHTVHVNT